MIDEEDKSAAEFGDVSVGEGGGAPDADRAPEAAHAEPPADQAPEPLEPEPMEAELMASDSGSSTADAYSDAPPRGEKHWYILKVQSNREDSIRDALQRRIAVAGLND